MKFTTENHQLLKVFIDKKVLVITDKLYEQIDNVKFDPLENNVEGHIKLLNSVKSVFSKIPNRNYYVYLTSHRSIIYEFKKTDDSIKLVMWFAHDEYDPIRYFYELSLKDDNLKTYFKEGSVTGLKNTTEIGLNIYFENQLNESFELFCLQNIYQILMRTLIFIEFSKDRVILKDLKPKEKFGDILKGNLIKNETNRNITIVDSLWNVTSIGIGEYKVRGHFRLQRCGVGLCDVKLVYIDEFIKNHYIRRSTREMTFS